MSEAPRQWIVWAFLAPEAQASQGAELTPHDYGHEDATERRAPTKSHPDISSALLLCLIGAPTNASAQGSEGEVFADVNEAARKTANPLGLVGSPTTGTRAGAHQNLATSPIVSGL